MGDETCPKNTNWSAFITCIDDDATIVKKSFFFGFSGKSDSGAKTGHNIVVGISETKVHETCPINFYANCLKNEKYCHNNAKWYYSGDNLTAKQNLQKYPWRWDNVACPSTREYCQTTGPSTIERTKCQHRCMCRVSSDTEEGKQVARSLYKGKLQHPLITRKLVDRCWVWPGDQNGHEKSLGVRQKGFGTCTGVLAGCHRDESGENDTESRRFFCY